MDQVILISILLIIGMIGFVVLSAIISLADRERKFGRVKSVLKMVILIGCVGIILYETILFRPVMSEAMCELSPFWSYRLAFMGDRLYRTEIILNYLLYVPFGFMLKSVFGKMKWWQCLFICFLSSAMIETYQFVFRIGLFEWDDMIGNSLGGLIGYGCYSWMNRIIKHWWGE